MKKFLIAAILAVIAAAPAVAQAQGGTSPPPADKALPSWMQYKSPYTGQEYDISNPHRTSEEIETWSEQAAADVLSFNKGNYMWKMRKFKKYFTDSGWKEYTDYLKTSRIIDMVASDKYSIGAIVDEQPLIINQGDVGGAYNWILRMPVTISFFTKDATGTEQTGPSAKFYLFIDVARVANGGGQNGIAISNWRMESNVKKGD